MTGIESDPLIGMLTRLKLTAIRDQLDSLVDEARPARVDHPGGVDLVLRARDRPRGSLLITSNRSVGEWGAVFGDAVVATAILDRLLHHSHVITIRGDSYRLREKRRTGLFKTPAATAQGAPAST